MFGLLRKVFFFPNRVSENTNHELLPNLTINGESLIENEAITYKSKANRSGGKYLVLKSQL